MMHCRKPVNSGGFGSRIMLAIKFPGVAMPYKPLLRSFVPLLLAAGSPAVGHAQDSLAGCRAITDSAARLACYDRLPLPGAAAAAPVAPSGQSPVMSPGAQPPRPAGAPAAPTGAAVAPAAPAPEASRFGLPALPNAEVQTVQSEIPGHFNGWQAGSRIRLANGQVWQVTDGTSRFANVDNPRVTVRRGALGSFFLEIDGVTPSPRVRRIE